MNFKFISPLVFFLYLMCSSVLYAGSYAGETKAKLAKEVAFPLKASQSQYIREHQFELVDAAQVGDCDSITKHYYKIMNAGQIDASELMAWYASQTPQKRRSDYGKHIEEVLMAPDIMINSRLFVMCNTKLMSVLKLPKQTKEEGKAAKMRVQKAVDDAKACGAAYGHNVSVSFKVSDYLEADNPNIANERGLIEGLEYKCSSAKEQLAKVKVRVAKEVDKFIECAKEYGADTKVPVQATQFLSKDNFRRENEGNVERELLSLCRGFKVKSESWW